MGVGKRLGRLGAGPYKQGSVGASVGAVVCGMQSAVCGMRYAVYGICSQSAEKAASWWSGVACVVGSSSGRSGGGVGRW